ncbi:MAG TPA: hypothetical protein VLD86_03025, partial [Ilumatobacteraceae bacterium]|nr:hypothetical protein [Ilumatobacteraceae bacterium]
MRRTVVRVVALLALVLGFGVGVASARSPQASTAAELVVVEQGFQWLGPIYDHGDDEARWGVFLHNPNPDTWVASGSVEVTFLGADGSVVGTASQPFGNIQPNGTKAIGSRSASVTAEPLSMTVDAGDVTWLPESSLPAGELTATLVSDDLTAEGYRHVVAAIQSTLPTDAWARPVFVLRDNSGALLGMDEDWAVVPAGAEVGAEDVLFSDAESSAHVTVAVDVDWDARPWSGATTNPPAGVLPLEVVEVGGGWYESTAESGASWGALIRNPNPARWVAQMVQLTTTFRDGDGRIVGADYDSGFGDVLPGQTVGVGTQYTWSPEAVTIEVSAVAQWAEVDQLPSNSPVTFTDIALKFEGGGLSAVTANATVPADQISGNGISVAIIYRDSSDRIVGGRIAYAPVTSGTGPIEVDEYTHVTNVASAEMYAYYIADLAAPAEAMPETGVFRNTGTFSPEVTANIPAPTDISTDPPVMYANLILAALAVLALTIGVRLLNTTLVAHEDALEAFIRPAKALGSWWARADKAVAGRTGGAAEIVRVLGVLLFYGVLFSFLEPGWRPWTVSGLFVLAVMTIAFGVVGTGDDLVEMRSARRWGLPARLVVKPALVLLAMGSVVLTKFAQLVPGLLIGTPEAFSMEDEVSERDETRLAIVGLGSTLAIGLGAWALSAPLDGALDGSGGFVQGLLGALVTLLVLTFAVAIENLFANLLAFPGSEGAALRRRSRIGWWAAMIAVTGLFFHTLINPAGDLAESMRSTNVRVVLITVGAFLVFSGGVWAWFHWRDQHRPP